MGFGMVIGFIGLFDRARDYTLHFTVTHILMSTVMCSLLLLGNGFQRWMLPSSEFLNYPCTSLPTLRATEPQQSSD
jgi:hypothetical protein